LEFCAAIISSVGNFRVCWKTAPSSAAYFFQPTMPLVDPSSVLGVSSLGLTPPGPLLSSKSDI